VGCTNHKQTRGERGEGFPSIRQHVIVTARQGSDNALAVAGGNSVSQMVGKLIPPGKLRWPGRQILFYGVQCAYQHSPHERRLSRRASTRSDRRSVGIGLRVSSLWPRDRHRNCRRQVNLDQIILIIQRFTRRWPDVKRFPGDAALAEGDTDGGFERLLRSRLEAAGVPGDVALARELHFHDGRHGAIVPQHESDLVLRLDDGPCVIEGKAWRDVVDKGPIIVFLGKVLDFIAAPKFDTVADSLKVGFIGLSGFTEAARRIMFAFGIVPFSKLGADLSFRFLDLQLAELERRCNNSNVASAEEMVTARALIGPFVTFERRKLTDIVRVQGDEFIVDLGGLRRGAALYDEARAAHAYALDVYRKVSKHFAG
jgi:hypothetical protein